MKLLYIYLLIIAVGIILYLEWNNPAMYEQFGGGNESLNDISFHSKLQNYLNHSIQSNQALKELLIKNQNYSSNDIHNVMKLAETNQEISKVMNNLNFE